VLSLLDDTDALPSVVECPKVLADPSGKLAMKVIDLTEVDETPGAFTRSIVDCLTPSEYFDDLSDYLNML